jgi:hypothetical protein
MCQNYSRVSENLTLRVKPHFACGNRTLRVDIHFLRVEITFVCVGITIVSVEITRACKNYTRTRRYHYRGNVSEHVRCQ